MRILFCDDNPEIVLELQKYVSSFFRELGGPVPELIAYTSGDAVVSDNPKVDIAFLDVEIHQRNLLLTERFKIFIPGKLFLPFSPSVCPCYCFWYWSWV